MTLKLMAVKLILASSGSSLNTSSPSALGTSILSAIWNLFFNGFIMPITNGIVGVFNAIFGGVDGSIGASFSGFGSAVAQQGIFSPIVLVTILGITVIIGMVFYAIIKLLRDE